MDYKESKDKVQIILHERKSSHTLLDEKTLTPEKVEKGWARISDKDLDDMKIFASSNRDAKDIKDAYAVFYSGGWDSTALIIQHLLAGDTVLPVCVNFNSTLHQRIASQATLYKLSLLFPQNLFCLRSITDIEGLSVIGYGLTQQPLTAFFAGLMGLNCKQIEFGYCMNDCAIAYADDIQALYKAASMFKANGCLSDIQQDVSASNAPIPPMVFPLSKTPHEYNVEYVKSFIAEYGELPIVSSCDTYVEGYYNKKEDICKFIVHNGGKDSCGKEERFETMDIVMPGKLTNYVNLVIASFKLKNKGKAITTAKAKATGRKLRKLLKNKKESSDDSIDASERDIDSETTSWIP